MLMLAFWIIMIPICLYVGLLLLSWLLETSTSLIQRIARSIIKVLEFAIHTIEWIGVIAVYVIEKTWELGLKFINYIRKG